MSQTESSKSRKPAVIFVVDDEPMLLDLAVAILEPQGFIVRTFRDPRQALTEYSTVKPNRFMAKPYRVHDFVDTIRQVITG